MKFAPDHQYWGSSLDKLMSSASINNESKEDQPTDLNYSRFSVTKPTSPYFRGSKEAAYVQQIYDENAKYGRLEQFPDIDRQLPENRQPYSDDQLNALKQEGICWSPELRADEHTMAVEVFGVPSYNMLGYIRTMVTMWGCDLLAWYESKRSFSGRIDVTVDMGRNKPAKKVSQEYATCQIILMIPTSTYSSQKTRSTCRHSLDRRAHHSAHSSPSTTPPLR